MPRYSPEDYDALLAMLRQRQGTPGNSRFDIEELDIAPLNIPWDLRAGLPQAPQQNSPVYASPQGGQMPGMQALAPQSAPMPSRGDPYAGTPAPRAAYPGAPSASYRLPNQDWTQVPLDQSGQPIGTPGNRPAMAEAQQQPASAPQAAAPQAQQQQQFAAAPQPPSAQQAMNYLHRLGYDTSSPDVARLVPRAQEALHKQAMDQYKSNLSIANTQSQIASRADQAKYAGTELADTGTNLALIDKRTGQTTRQIPKDVAGKERAEVLGKQTGQAEFDLPRVAQNAEQTIKVIGDIKNHPGIDLGTGWAGWAAKDFGGIPGTDQRAFIAQVNQLKGKAFLEAYNILKGSGQISEKEGEKATDSVARLDVAQSKEDFLTALGDLEDVVKTGLSRAQAQAGGGGAAQQPEPAGKIRVWNPTSGKLE
jgi:hypothetical protein